MAHFPAQSYIVSHRPQNLVRIYLCNGSIIDIIIPFIGDKANIQRLSLLSLRTFLRGNGKFKFIHILLYFVATAAQIYVSIFQSAFGMADHKMTTACL